MLPVQLTLLDAVDHPAWPQALPSLAPVHLPRREHQAALGQFMTPELVACHMAGLLPAGPLPVARVLDAGAGQGALSRAVLARWRQGAWGFEAVEVDAYEIDPLLLPALRAALAPDPTPGARQATPQVLATDFISHAVSQCLQDQAPRYTHAILNPPYKKIAQSSTHRLMLRSVGIETVNLYSAFVALAIERLLPGGWLVAIIPRSFCNGPYYRPFREHLLARCAIRHLHLFESRRDAFRSDAVLQENLILLLEKGGAPGEVVVAHSTGADFADVHAHRLPFHEIVQPEDGERFIRIPTPQPGPPAGACPGGHQPLSALGVQVSTGPVVDFRLRDHLHAQPQTGCVPLLYPGNFSGGRLRWPVATLGKAQAIADTPATRKWLYPAGTYCVVRRFSAKEERRRVVASVLSAAELGGAAWVGLENHLNVFHIGKHGLPPELAHGLAAWLNTSRVDQDFRQFSGHTQVNATDLKQMRYPSRAQLEALGRWAMQQPTAPTQAALDAQVDEVCA